MYMEKNLDITKPLSGARTLIVSPLALRYIRVPLYIDGRFLQHLEDVRGNGPFAFGLFRQCITSYIAYGWHMPVDDIRGCAILKGVTLINVVLK